MPEYPNTKEKIRADVLMEINQLRAQFTIGLEETPPKRITALDPNLINYKARSAYFSALNNFAQEVIEPLPNLSPEILKLIEDFNLFVQNRFYEHRQYAQQNQGQEKFTTKEEIERADNFLDNLEEYIKTRY